jgi:phage minor structural protein
VPAFRNAAALKRYAEIKIAEMAWPRVTYAVQIVNLADFGMSAEEINLGSWFTLYDDEIDIDVNVQIVRVVYDLVHGERVSVELAAKSIDICDIVPGDYVL